MSWLTYHRRESQKLKKDQLLTLHKNLASFFTKKLIQALPYELRYSESPISLLSTELVQTLTVTHAQHNACKRLSLSVP